MRVQLWHEGATFAARVWSVVSPAPRSALVTAAGTLARQCGLGRFYDATLLLHRYNLGICFERGEGLPKDVRQAAAWYSKAAEQAAPRALAHARQLRIPSRARSAGWMALRSVAQGYAAAQLNLGMCYKRGEGAPKDYATAIGWMKKAAQAGNATAAFSVGMSYEKGEGVERNLKLAVEYYQRAAEGGSAPAQVRSHT